MSSPPLHVALVSEHANPIAPVGNPETGGQNVYVAALARHLGRVGCTVDVYTRRSDEQEPPQVALSTSVTVHHVPVGPAAAIPRDHLMPVMPEFARGLGGLWAAAPPDVVHAHFLDVGLGLTPRGCRPRPRHPDVPRPRHGQATP